MARTLDQVCERYERNLRTGGMILGRANTVEEQVAHFRAAQVHARDLAARSGTVLRRLDQPSIRWPYYYAFVWKMDALVRRGISGMSLQLEVGRCVDYWSARGLDRAALVAVCREVLDVEPEFEGWTESGTGLK
jgi:hypothetical protein